MIPSPTDTELASPVAPVFGWEHKRDSRNIMKLMLEGMVLLKADAVRRVRMPAKKLTQILREFDCSGASGVEFAKRIGPICPTSADRINKSD